MATHATIPVDHDTKARFLRHVAVQQQRTGRRVTHSWFINHLLDLVDPGDLIRDIEGASLHLGG